MNTGPTHPIPILVQAQVKVDQVGILVENLEAAIDVYGVNSVNAGAAGWNTWTYGPRTMSSAVLRNAPAEFEIRIALLASDPVIELIELVHGPSIYEDWIAHHGYGLHHLGFFVPELHQAISQMRGGGYDLLQAGWGTGADGTGGFAYFDTTAACGYITEAIELPIIRRPPESA